MHIYMYYVFCEGKDSATAASIFKKMDRILKDNGIPWNQCIGVSVDNTSVNLGKRNSIMTRIQEVNEAIYFMGCPCHIIHNTCMKASDIFTSVSTVTHVCKCLLLFDTHRLHHLTLKI